MNDELFMAPEKLAEIKGPFIIWFFFTLYYVILATGFWRTSSDTALPADFSLGIALSLLMNIAISYGVPLAFLVIFVAFWEKRRQSKEVFSSLGLRSQGAARSVFWSVVLFPLIMIAGLVGFMLGFFGTSATVSVSSNGQMPLWFLWYMVVYAFFPVAVGEEMFARGYLLDRLMPEHPSGLVKALPAILLSSILFTLWHVPGYVAGYSFSILKSSALLAGNVFPISVILSVAYVKARTRNILGPVLVHFLLDSLPTIMMLTQVQVV